MLPLLAVNISLKFLSYENTASAVDIYEWLSIVMELKQVLQIHKVI
jgi:hypothetical protein